MPSTIELNADLIRKRVSNVREAARTMGIRQATLSDLLTGKTQVEKAEVGTLAHLAEFIGCDLDDLLLRKDSPRETFAESMARWANSGDGTRTIKGARVEDPVPERDRVAIMKALPDTRVNPAIPRRKRPNPL